MTETTKKPAGDVASPAMVKRCSVDCIVGGKLGLYASPNFVIMTGECPVQILDAKGVRTLIAGLNEVLCDSATMALPSGRGGPPDAA